MPKLFHKKETRKSQATEKKLADEHDFIRKQFGEYWMNPKEHKFEKILKDGVTKQKKKDFQLTLKLHDYKPEEVVVSTNGNVVEVKGKHQERDEKGEMQTVRSFIKSFSVSEDCDVTQLRSKFEKDGVLTISAPKKIE